MDAIYSRLERAPPRGTRVGGWSRAFARTWVEGDYAPLRFSRGAIEADAADTWRLTP
ncbi:MAG: hypothetical protein RLO52_30015 [Sandaracinaceae bacterium]